MNLADVVENQRIEIDALRAELNTLKQRCEQYSQAYDSLQHQVKELLRHRFGRKSERYIDDASNPQHNLWGNPSLSTDNEGDNNAVPETVQVPAHVRKKKTTTTKDLPRRIEIIPVAELDKHCACGACKTVIRYETKESLHYEPAVFEILEQRREVVACPHGCEQSMITAAVPLHVLPKAKVTEEFLSFLVVSKLDDRQPLYHLERQLKERHGIDCSRQTMARWLGTALYSNGARITRRHGSSALHRTGRPTCHRGHGP